MEQEKNEVLVNKGKDFAEKAKIINNSIRSHLDPEYRKQYNIRRFTGCALLFLLFRSMISDSTWPFLIEDSLIHRDSIFPMIYCVIAWKFWHYAFWRFQGGIIDNLSKSIFYIGSIWAVVGKIFLQHFLILMWVAFIAPISGIITWRKAVKNNKYLFIENEKNVL